MYDVHVHHQLLKTPQGNPFQVPTLSLAQAIEEEWEKAPECHYQRKPLTSLAATALDRVAPNRETYVQDILALVSKDSLLFWETKPETLVKLQEEKWAPILEEINEWLGLHLNPTTSLTIQPLSPEEETRVKDFLLGPLSFCEKHTFSNTLSSPRRRGSRGRLEKMETCFFNSEDCLDPRLRGDDNTGWEQTQSPFKLAALSHLLTLTSSFCLSCLLMEKRLSPEEAWGLAHLHEHYQRLQWGEDPEAFAQEERQRAEFLETVRFIKLL
jgi:chaperone required for assembly of F1-ATPase